MCFAGLTIVGRFLGCVTSGVRVLHPGLKLQRRKMSAAVALMAFDAATYMNTQWSVFASAKRGVTSLVFQLMRGESTRVLDDGLNNARLRVRP